MSHILIKIFPHISRTFAFTIPKLPKPIDMDLMISYAICRYIDSIEDSSLPPEEKKNEMNRFLGDLKEKKKHKANADIPYDILSKNINAVIAIYHELPSDVQKAIFDCASEMAEGFLLPEVQSIATLEDQNRYCHYAAGVVGTLITKIFEIRGLVKPSPEMYQLAHDFGLALQKVNILKDVKEDLDEGRSYWPEDLWKKYHIEGEKRLIHSENHEQLVGELTDDANLYIQKALDYIDLLPFDPPGLRIHCADNLLMAIATLREVPQKKLFETGVKISRSEVQSIDAEVQKCVRDGQSIRNLAKRIQHQALDL